MVSVLQYSIVRYFISGAVAVCVHLGILALLVEFLFLNPVFSTTIGFLVGSVVNYLMQFYWAFAADGNHYTRFLRYGTVTAITAAINSGVFWMFHELADMTYLPAQIATTAIIFLLNYEANRRFTFA